MRAPIFVAGLFALAAGSALAQAPAPGFADRASTGYLTPAQTPDAAAFLAPPPPIRSARQQSELAHFRATRRAEGTPRWALAASDNTYSAAAMMRNMSCAAGAVLEHSTSPRLAVLLAAYSVDSGRASNTAKAVFKRQRPYLFAKGGVCIARSQALDDSPDYPSGHSSFGWGSGLILAELSPERSSAIMSRARSYGDSRIVCGVHTQSAVEAGRQVASAVVGALHASSLFRADMDAARAEIRAAQARGAPPAGQCAAEAALIATTPY